MCSTPIERHRDAKPVPGIRLIPRHGACLTDLPQLSVRPTDRGLSMRSWSLSRMISLHAPSLSLLGLLATACASYGQTSDLYGVSVLPDHEIHVWRSGSLQKSWSVPGNYQPPLADTAIAVAGEVRTLNRAPGLVGHEWTLQGDLIGQTVPNPGLGLLDGTTDGVAFNYAVGDYTEPVRLVYRFDRNWANPVPLFSSDVDGIPANGITFDPATQTLWLAGHNRVENRRLDGSLISGFQFPSPPSNGPYAGLAFDPADRTLWYADYGGAGRLLQFSLTGELIGEIPLSQQDYWGLEFAIPEPTSVLLLSIAGLASTRRRT